MNMNMTKAEKAKQLRYKKAVLDDFNLESICTELEEISYNCEEIRWVINGEEGTLIAALDGDDEEAFEFRMGFSELDAECEELYELLHDEYVTEYFDNFLAGISEGSGMRLVGYDDYEADYYGLIGYDETLGCREAKKRIERLTKQQIISAANQTFRTLMCFLNIRYKYDYLKASFDVLKGENTSFLDSIRQIEKEYDDIMTHSAEDIYSVRQDRERHFDMLVAELPDKVWVE